MKESVRPVAVGTVVVGPVVVTVVGSMSPVSPGSMSMSKMQAGRNKIGSVRIVTSVV